VNELILQSSFSFTVLQTKGTGSTWVPMQPGGAGEASLVLTQVAGRVAASTNVPKSRGGAGIRGRQGCLALTVLGQGQPPLIFIATDVRAG